MPAKNPDAPKREHIFPATIVEPLAVQWKKLVLEGKHEEANIILEDIILKSSQMFARLAQHEGYHNTVDLDSLVLAAQARVAAWLTYWDPAKGALFSWLSKSLAGNSLVLLDDGTQIRIDEIVDKKLDVKVMSWDGKQLVPKRITHWLKSPAVPPPKKRKSKKVQKFNQNDLWRLVSVKHSLKQRGSQLILTGDHEVLTQRGWIMIDDMMTDDVMFMPEKLLTTPGKRAKLARCSVKIKPVYNCHGKNYNLDLNWKYDITVEDTKNFVANGIVVHNCSKNLFLGEVVRASQHRKRFFPTSDNLEKFVGSEDHAVSSNEAIDGVQEQIKQITSRWNDPQINCCIRFHIACIVENPKVNKKLTIKAGAYASGLNLDLSKFFYNWALFALRNAMYDKLDTPYTEQDLLRLANSFTYIPDLLNIISWEQMVKIIALLGGNKIKFPTLTQMDQLKEEYRIYRQLSRSNLDPESFAKIAKASHISEESAETIYERISTTLNDDHDGEFSLYD